MSTIGICGLGGASKEIYELICRINDNQWDEVIFVDKVVNEPGQIFRGCKVYSFEDTKTMYSEEEIEYVISVGDVYLREKIFKQIKSAGYNLATIIAPGVYIPQSVMMGEGVIIRENCFISVDTIFKDNAMIQPNVAIGHDVIVNENSIVSAHCSIAGGVLIGRNTYIALNCAIKELISIGSDSIVAMGSVVNKNVGDNVIVSGNPARVLSKNYIRSAFRLNAENRKNA